MTCDVPVCKQQARLLSPYASANMLSLHVDMKQSPFKLHQKSIQLSAPACSIAVHHAPKLTPSAFNLPLLLQEGYGEFQVYHDKGQRADMFRQYLRPVLGRSNLTVVTGAQMQQIIFEKQGSRPRARGVAFSIGGPDGDKHSGAFGLNNDCITFPLGLQL